MADQDKPACDPMLLRHVRAEAHQHRGGHQSEVQAELAKLSTTTARWLLHALREQRNKLQRARSQPWRKIP